MTSPGEKEGPRKLELTKRSKTVESVVPSTGEGRGRAGNRVSPSFRATS